VKLRGNPEFTYHWQNNQATYATQCGGLMFCCCPFFSYAYLSYLDGGLEIVDFSDPDSPRSAGYAASSGEANDLAVRYGVAFVQLNPRLQNTCVEWYSPRKDAALRGVFSHPPHLDVSVLLRQSFLVLRLFICRE